MNSRQQRQFNSITQCQALLRKKDFNTPEIDPLRKRYDAAASDLVELFEAQIIEHGARTGDGGRLKTLRKDIRLRLYRISRHAIGVLDGMPGIREDVRVPHANAKDADLLKAAARIIKNLRPHVSTLHATGLPRDAFPRLLADMKALKAKAADPDTAIARRSRVTASIPSAIRRARALAKALDTAIKADLGMSANAEWAAAYRIPARKGRPKKRPPNDDKRNAE